MRPDIVICWPRSCDYPLWRQMIRNNRDRFQSIIIVFTETHYGEDYREFVSVAMQQDNCTFLDCLPIRGDQDWRNISVNAGLLYSTSDWILFTEQDFLPTRDLFWIETEYLSRSYDAFGYFADGRLHPCCIYIKRDILDTRTKRNFGVIKDELDHFGMIQKNLEEQGIKVASISHDNCHHMNGLSQNYSMAFAGQLANYHPEEFNEYLEKCLQVNVPHDTRFRSFALDYLKRVKPTWKDV